MPRVNAGVDFYACSGNEPIRIGDIRSQGVPGQLSFTYAWTGSDGTLGFDTITKSNPTVSFINSTQDSIVRTYFVKVTRGEANQPTCFNSDTIRVVIFPKPIARTIPPNVSKACFGDTITLRAEKVAGFLYQWLNSSTVINPTPSKEDDSLNVTTTGRYRLVLRNPRPVRGGICADTSSGDSIFIKAKVKAMIRGFANYCRGKSDTLIASPVLRPFYTYQWYKDSTTLLIGERDTILNARTPGFYQVILADSKEGITCYDTSESVRVDSIRTPFNDIVKLSGDSTFPICSGQVPITVVAPLDTNYPNAFQYLWHDGTTRRQFVYDTAGVYFVKVFNRCGSATDTLKVTDLFPTPTFNILSTAANDTLLCKDIPYVLRGDPGFVYNWYLNDTLVGFTPTYSFLTGDTTGDSVVLKVVLKSLNNNCIQIDSAFLKVVNCEPVVYIPTAFSPDGNDINDAWILQVYSVVTVKARVYNRWGEQVYFANTLNDLRLTPWKGTYKDKDCPSGAYQYVIEYTGKKPGTEIINSFKKTGTVTLLR